MAGKFRMYVDEFGVPDSDYGRYNGLDIGRRRSILAIAERGLWWWNAQVRPREEPDVLLSYDWRKWPANVDPTPLTPEGGCAVLLRCADWLIDALQPRDGFSVWAYDYPFSYETAAGWRSAHAQAVALQLLVRAAEITSDPGYLSSLDDALAAFAVDVADGGLATSAEGFPWFEKMADPGNEQPRVLNGHLFATLGLLDVARRTANPAAAALGATGVDTALRLIPRFDTGDWSAYDVHGRRASAHYHDVHIRQFARLFEMTGLAEFNDWRERFEAYAAP